MAAYCARPESNYNGHDKDIGSGKVALTVCARPETNYNSNDNDIGSGKVALTVCAP